MRGFTLIATIFLATLSFTSLSAGSAQATVISLTTADGLGADTFLNGGSENFAGTGVARRDTNFGDLDVLVVKYSPSGANNNDTDFDSQFTRLTLLRFDLSSVTGTVTAATLTLGVKLTESATANGPPANVSFTLTLLPDGAALDAAPAQGGWSETGITMANSLLAGSLPLTGVAGPNTVLGGTDTETSFTGNTLRDRIRDDTNDLITFAILPFFNSPQGIQFFSKENLDGGLFPTLELTVIDDDTTTVPEPHALAIFALGLLGLGLARKKRTR